MSQSAKVTSIDALDSFRAGLIVYLSKAARVLDDATDDVSRTKIWLQTECLTKWKREIRLRRRALDQANAELMTERLAQNREAVQARKIAVRRARERVEEAEEKLARVKYWIRHYETTVEAKTKVVHQLRHYLDYDMKKALAFLEGAARSLADYAELKPTSPGARSHPPGDGTSNAPEGGKS